jgi:pyrroline-5-carboxylate reductase
MKRIGILGFGNMGSAIAEQIKSAYEIFIFDKDKNKTQGVRALKVAENIQNLVKSSEVVILAIKPQDFDGVLNEIIGVVKDKLVISIAAGITTAHIEKLLGDVRAVRGMPNLPAKIKQGMTCLCKGRFASAQDLEFAQELFNRVGNTLIINENMMDAATAISGSGPAYVCSYLESKKEKEKFLNDFQEAAKAIGFNAQQAEILVNATFSGTVEFLKKTKLVPSGLKKQVASKGGTTEAALQVLESGGTLKEAVKAAKKRAEELSRR